MFLLQTNQKNYYEKEILFMKEKIKEILDLIQSVVEILDEIAEDELEEAKTKNAPKKKASVKEGKLSDKNETVSSNEDEEDSEEITEEDLKEMSYNDLKAYAKSIGIKAVGSHKQLLANILKTLEDEEENEDEEKNAVSVKKSDPNEDEDEEDEEENDALRAELVQMDVKELADILSEAGLSVKGKKEALVTRIIKAVEDGLIEFEEADEDEEADESIEDTETEEDEDDTEDNEYELNDPENPNMTKERRDAVSALTKEVQAGIKKKKITDDDMTEFLISVGYTKKEIKGLDDIADTYLQERALFINDDGEEVEKEESYFLNGEPACCGKLLEKDGDTYTCSICGGEYEADEDEDE